MILASYSFILMFLLVVLAGTVLLRRFGKHHGPRASFEELDLQAVFKSANLVADRRWRYRQLLGRCGEREMTGHGLERP